MLPCVLIALAFASLPTTPRATSCDLVHANCNTVHGKRPPADTPPDPTTPRAVTAELTPGQRREFEHLLGHALRETDGVRWATREFSTRVSRFLTYGGALNGSSADEALAAAFITPKAGPGNTGYVGPNITAIKAALATGNIREVWGLMYVLTKTHYFCSLLTTLLSPRKGGGAPLATPLSLQSALGMDAAAVSARWAQLVASRALNSTEMVYSQGVVDFIYEPFASWVRFDFAAVAHDGSQLWGGARASLGAPRLSQQRWWWRQFGDKPRAQGCDQVSMRTDDPSIEPPVSPAEAAYQCAPGHPPCKLKWNPGMLCYYLTNASWAVQGGEALPGYKARADLLGYRAVAAPSGTTANMLQLGSLLGFSADELALLRATMAAWMLPTDDHSFLEIMLGAETFVSTQLGVKLGRDDLGQLWPPGRDLRTSGGTFLADDTWRAVGGRLATPDGQALLQAMSAGAREYVQGLVGTNNAP